MIKNLIVNAEFRGSTTILIGNTVPADGTLFYTIGGVLYALNPPESSTNKALYISDSVPYWDVITGGTAVVDTVPPSRLSMMGVNSYSQNSVQLSGGANQGLTYNVIIPEDISSLYTLENTFRNNFINDCIYNDDSTYGYNQYSFAPMTMILSSTNSLSMSITGPEGDIIHIDYGDGQLVNYTMTGSSMTITHSYTTTGNYTITMYGNVNLLTAIDLSGNAVSSFVVSSGTNLVNLVSDSMAYNVTRLNALLATLVASGKTNGTLTIKANSNPTGQGLTDKATLESRGWTITITVIVFPDIYLKFEGTNNSTTFTDSSGNSLAFTAYGNAKLTTANSAFGKSSGTFDTGSYVNSASTSNVSFSGAFTVRFKIYNISAYVIMCAGSWDGDFWGIQTSSNSIGIQMNGWHDSSVQLPYNTWSDIEFCRDSSNIVRLFLDGTNILEFTQAGTYPSTSNVLTFGGGNIGGGVSLIDELMIYKDNCLHTGNFTPVPIHTGDPIYLTLTSASSVSMTVTGTASSVITVDYGDGTSGDVTMTGSAVTLSHTYSGSGTYIITISGSYNSLTAIDFNTNPITDFKMQTGNNFTNINGNESSLSAAKVNSLLAVLVATGKTNGTLTLTTTSLPTGQGLTDKATLESRGWTVTITAGAVVSLNYAVDNDWADPSYGSGTYTPYEGTPPDGSAVYYNATAFYGSPGYLTVTPTEGGYLWAIGTGIVTTMTGPNSWGCGISSTAPNTSGAAVYIAGGYGENGFPAGYTFTPQ